MNKIDFQKLDEKSIDYELLHKWSDQPFVIEWFEQRSLSPQEIKEKYDRKLREGKEQLFYIVYEGKRIGYFQYYPDTDPDMVEYDVLIGEEDCIDKGIGTEVVKKINGFIFDKTKTKKIMVRPCKRNKRACRCYEKSGFELIRDYSGHDTLGNQDIFSIYIIENDN